MEATRVLVVEDDAGLRGTLVRGLTEEGLRVTPAADGRSALAAVSGKEEAVGAVVLDIGLPDSDGRDVCQALRSRGMSAPVIFLTARAALGDVLSGYAAGGDDYLAKPFHFSELLARLTALARRSETPAVRRAPHMHLEPLRHSLVVGEQDVPLTPTEYRVLAVLLGAGDRVVRRRELVAAAWPAGAVVHDNTLDQYVARIRRKLAEFPTAAAVVTVHGVGYRLA